MLWLLLLLHILLPRPVFAAGSLTITNFTGSIVTNDIFNLTYTAVNLNVGDTYYIKVYGGVDPSTSQIYTVYNNQNLSSSSDWSNFPTTVIDAGGSASGTLNAIAPTISGSANLKLRFALTSSTGTQVNADQMAINIITPTPTPTPVPTSIPTPLPTNTSTPTPVPTNTPVPTDTPTSTPIPSSTPTPPAATPTPAPTDIPAPLETPQNDPLPTDDPNQPSVQNNSIAAANVLGDSSPLNIIPASRSNFIPTFFMIIGGLLLLSPLLAPKIISLVKKIEFKKKI